MRIDAVPGIRTGRRDVRRNILVFTVYTVLLFAISGIDLLPAHVLSHENALMIQYAVYCVMIALWAISVQNRLMTQALRRMHVLLVGIFVLRFFISRMHRLVFAGFWPEEHIFWYISYIPSLAMPLISFFMSLYVGRDDSFRLPNRAKLLVIPYVVLVLFILTNEYHQLAFRFADRGEAVSITGHYHVSFVYYVSQVWMFGLAALAILHLYYILSKHNLRAYILPPVVLIGLGLLYTVLYAFDRSPTGVGYIEPNAMMVFSTAGLWEVCIIMRLIPSNSGYGRLFDVCSVPMEIRDRNDVVCYRSAGYASGEPEQGRDTGGAGRTYLTRSFDIPAGSIRWREDVTEFQEVIRRLEAGRKTLEASNEKLDAQNRMRMREKKTAERARLYDEALLSTGDRIAKMREILRVCAAMQPEAQDTEAERQNALALLSVYGAYVKRRSNLVLLSDHTDALPLSELHFCIRETNEALVLVPVSTVYRNEADDTLMLPVPEIIRLYDAFQQVIEQQLEDMDHLRMTLSSQEKEVTLTLVSGGRGTGEETVTFSIPRGGQAA